MDISEKKGDPNDKYFAILFGVFSILIIRAKGRTIIFSEFLAPEQNLSSP